MPNMLRTSVLCLATLLGACAMVGDASDDARGIGGKGDGAGNLGVPFSFSRHTWPTDDMDLVRRDFELIAELGAKFVRTDIWWYAIEPTRGYYDEAALDYYRWYIEEAGRHGLGVVTILARAPDWVVDVDWASVLSRIDPIAFSRAFGAYADKVATKVGDLVTYWQIWNEPNHIIDDPNHKTDVQVMIEGRAGIERGRTANGTTRPFRTAINVLVDWHDSALTGHWEDDLRFYLNNGARKAVDIIAIDHYPGTWSIGDWGGNILERLFALGYEQDKAVAVFELGFTTSHCLFPSNTERAQANWIGDQLPRMLAKAFDPDVNRGAKLELVNWYELDDRDTSDCLNPEDRFGIVRSDRSKKPGFEQLQSEIEQFRSGTRPAP